MVAKRNIPESWKNQWHKPMISLFDYIPTRYEATEREKQIRSLIWDFKAGKRSKQVAAIVAGKIAENSVRLPIALCLSVFLQVRQNGRKNAIGTFAKRFPTFAGV